MPPWLFENDGPLRELEEISDESMSFSLSLVMIYCQKGELDRDFNQSFYVHSIYKGNIADVWMAAEKCNLRALKIAVYHHLVRPPHKLKPFFKIY